MKSQEMLLQLASVRPVASGAARTSKRDGWGSIVRKHYDLPQTELVCTVLSRLFPATMERSLSWARRKGWGSPFPAVAEHIVPQSQPTAAAAYQFDVWDPCNAIPLFKHIEEMYQEGHLSIMPTSARVDDTGIEFIVHVSANFHGRVLEYKQHSNKEQRQLPTDTRVKVHFESGDRRGLLTFGDLHEKKFRMHQAPSMRALFQKARMAWQQTHQNGDGIPNPSVDENYQNFLRHCTRLGDLLTRALQHVPSET